MRVTSEHLNSRQNRPHNRQYRDMIRIGEKKAIYIFIHAETADSEINHIARFYIFNLTAKNKSEVCVKLL
jgi:hypothetical protein